MRKVAAVLERKGRNAISVTPQTSVYEALEIMEQHNIGSVIVMDNGDYAGIVTERDYSRKVMLKGKSSTETPVAEIMSSDLPHVSPDDTIETCMGLMTANNIRYLPVFTNARLMGIISMSDVVKETILAQRETISQLESYIHSV